MPRSLAVRKILRASRALRELYLVAGVSTALSALGIITYVAWFSSDIVLVGSFVWLIEAISFLGLVVAFKAAASRALFYRARYEIMRAEALAALLISVVAIGVAAVVCYKALVKGHEAPTPAVLALYPLGSAATSYALERRLRSRLAVGLNIATVRTVADKLALDVMFEAAGGAAIIASNLLAEARVEAAVVVVVASYIAYGLYGIAKDSALCILGVGPSGTVRSIKRGILLELRRVTAYEVRGVKLRVHGTFAEAEVWLDAPAGMTLEEAYSEAVRIARRLVKGVPELLRALVFFVPAEGSGARGRRGRTRAGSLY